MVLFACILFGVFTGQVYFYWTSYQNDPIYIKTLVILVWIAEILHTAFCMHMMYAYFIEGYGVLEELLHIIWSAGATVYLMVLIVASAQGFYIFRIWTLSNHSYLVAGIPAVILFCRIAFGFATGSLLYTYDTWVAYRSERAVVITLNTGLSLAALVDVITTSLLVYYLFKNKGAFARTNQVIVWLVHYTVDTGAITMIMSLAIVFTYNFVDGSLLFAGLVEVVSKLYANTMLAMLNARQIMRNKSDVIDTVELSGQRRTHHRASIGQMGTRVEIFKETSMITDSHMDPTRSFDRDTEPVKTAAYDLP
ncbi:hypothetical protein NM688_g5604 [Phlebia brevispora]|uniref:Uncharacterized protein n=1 Tax=Phlebia brevispora TaxID=194682 RepID=A0ACC1ST81_9APHY|nr:hypothetical protein NM688_g5604 [Phlebia brevispora]